MANIVYIATSLDGFIAGPNGDIDWLTNYPNPEGGDYGFIDLMKRIDAIVMGRGTWEIVLRFLPQYYYTKPVVVWSSTITSMPEALTGKAEIFSGSLQGLQQLLKDKNYNNVYVDGGKTIQSFLVQDLIDEMAISRLPILLGGGIPLFGALSHYLSFTHVKTETFSNGITRSWYARKRG